ncbi:hypothetical protein JCM10207_002439 [Rhodosporidiobolus poonsookiae]
MPWTCRYWPLYYSHGYYGNDEYGPYNNSTRPGGSLAVASFSASGYNNTVPPQYLIYGDYNSVNLAISALQSDCQAALVANTTNVTDSGAYTSNPTASSNGSAPLLPAFDPQNVLSFYRSSSFALYSFFEGQTPDPALSTNYTAPNGSASTASTYFYPSSARDSSFESCVNSTISNALPIDVGESNAALRGTGVDPRAVAGAALVAGVVLNGGARWQLVAVLLAAVFLVAAQA